LRLPHHQRFDRDAKLRNLDIHARPDRNWRIRLNACAVDEDAIGAALINDGGTCVIHADFAVPSGNTRGLQNEPAVPIATDGHFARVDLPTGDFAAFTGMSGDDSPH